jgi:hypothetical protein
VAQLAAQLLAAQIIRNTDLASMVKRDFGTPTDQVHDEKLRIAILVAKRLLELSGE